MNVGDKALLIGERWKSSCVNYGDVVIIIEKRENFDKHTTAYVDEWENGMSGRFVFESELKPTIEKVLLT